MSFLEHYYMFGIEFEEKLREVLVSDAAEAVKDVMQGKLTDNVYSYPASREAMKTRRYEQGGLLDRENMVAHVEAGLTLVVEDIAPFQEGTYPDALSDVVQQGLPGYNQPGPRPFTADTESECVSSGAVLKAINEGLQRNGYKMELKVK